jgi:hypothetical protein
MLEKKLKRTMEKRLEQDTDRVDWFMWVKRSDTQFLAISDPTTRAILQKPDNKGARFLADLFFQSKSDVIE